MTDRAPLPVETRVEFRAAVKRAVRERSGGVCESHLIPRHMYGLPEQCANAGADFDHITPCAAGGDNTEGNCAFLCKPCHKFKTLVDNAMAKKANRRQGKTGQQARRKRNGSQIQSGGFRKPPKGYVSPLNRNHPSYRKGWK